MLDGLAPPRRIEELSEEEARVARALRLWVAMRGMGRCPVPAVADRMGSRRAAAHFRLLLDQIAAAWPEPFAVSPPCCCRLSHDEAMLVDMIRLAGRGDRPSFDLLTREMLPADARERLFLSAGMLRNAMEPSAP